MGRSEHRTRRAVPALAMLATLAMVAGAVWVELLRSERTTTLRVGCPAAPAGRSLEPVPYSALDRVAPVPPAAVGVRVLNTTSRSGLAARVAARLRVLGFARAAPPANDPVFPRGTMHCVGQIRFGRSGAPAARTLSLVAPCTQLVRDDRAGRGVDLALGTGFNALAPNQQARTVLRELNAWARSHPETPGGQQFANGHPPPLPPSLLAGARAARC